MNFRVSGLPIEQFASVLALDDAGLSRSGIARRTVDEPNAYPCRITLEDALPGEEVLLLTYAHQPAGGPYASSGPIFIRRGATATRWAVNEVPEQQRRRLLSVRAYDHEHCIVDADVTPGEALESLIARLLNRDEVSYLQVHNARYGCYACRVDRA